VLLLKVIFALVRQEDICEISLCWNWDFLQRES